MAGFSGILLIIALVLVSGLIAWEAVTNFGYEARKTEVAILFYVWLAVVGGYLAARILKKTGVLGEG